MTGRDLLVGLAYALAVAAIAVLVQLATADEGPPVCPGHQWEQGPCPSW